MICLSVLSLLSVKFVPVLHVHVLFLQVSVGVCIRCYDRPLPIKFVVMLLISIKKTIFSLFLIRYCYANYHPNIALGYVQQVKSSVK